MSPKLKETRPAEITSKNTKKEILDAYNKVLNKLEGSHSSGSSSQQTKIEDLLVAKATSSDKNDMVRKLADLKIEIGQYLSDLEEKLVSERERLEDFTKAKQVEEKRLKEFYDINVRANTLEALIIAEKEKRAQLQSDSKNELARLERLKEDKEMEWNRAKEEYEYKLKIKQRQDQDQYNQKSAQLERELIEKKNKVDKDLLEREEKLKAQENDLIELRKFKQNSEKIIQEKITQAQQEVSTKLSQQYEYDIKIKEKETEGEVSLLKQRIKLLEEKLKEKQDSAKDLAHRMHEAQQQAHDLAKKVIESARHIDRFTQKKEDTENKSAEKRN